MAPSLLGKRSKRGRQRVQDWYPMYDGFPWESVMEYLQEQFPDWTATGFNHEEENGYHKFEVPQALTQDQRQELHERKEAQIRAQMERPASRGSEEGDANRVGR